MSAALHAARWFLALLFLWTGTVKLRDPHAFAAIIADYRILPAIAPIVAWLLILADLLAGTALLAAAALSRWQVTAGLAAAALLALFAAAMAINLRRGRRIQCGCGSDSATLSWPTAITTLLLALPAAATAIDLPPEPPLLLVQSAVAGCILLILHTTAHQLASHRPLPRGQLARDPLA